MRISHLAKAGATKIKIAVACDTNGINGTSGPDKSNRDN